MPLAVALTGVIAAVAAAAVARRFNRALVSGTSMLPTLAPGDRLLTIRGLPIRSGDLVVVPDPREPARWMVKRVASIGRGGVHLSGDNPAESTDSRHFGAVAAESITGRAIYRYWPPDKAGRIGRHPGYAWHS